MIEWIVLGAAFVVLAAMTRAAGSRGGGGGGLSAGALSPIRRRAIEILRDVLPAAYPDERFARIVGKGFDPTASEATTCGALPGYMGTQLGDPGGITHWGVPGVRDVAKATGSWVEAGSGRAPRPGDIYLTAFPPGDPRAGQVSHTGVIVDVEGQGWTTADAGQGTRLTPRAELVARLYDARTNRIRQALNPESEGRTLLGWLDLDAYARARGDWPFPKRSNIENVRQAWRFEDAPVWDPSERARS